MPSAAGSVSSSSRVWVAARAIRPTSLKQHSSNKNSTRNNRTSFGMIRRSRQSFRGRTAFMRAHYNKRSERHPLLARRQIVTTLPPPCSQSPQVARSDAPPLKTQSCSAEILERYTSALGNAERGMAVRMTGNGMRKKDTHVNHGSAACVQLRGPTTCGLVSGSIISSSISGTSIPR
jgi:hypothetical protein